MHVRKRCSRVCFFFLSFTEPHPAVEASFPRNLGQKNDISSISNMCESWQQRISFWKIVGAQEVNFRETGPNMFLGSLELHKTATPRVEARFPRNPAQKNGLGGASNVCGSWQQQVDF
jgi:hypothetical protein